MPSRISPDEAADMLCMQAMWTAFMIARIFYPLNMTITCVMVNDMIKEASFTWAPQNTLLQELRNNSGTILKLLSQFPLMGLIDANKIY